MDQREIDRFEPTQVAVLGTLAEFHQEPIPYDLQALVDLVVDIHPDLLCLDMALEQWQQQELSNLPPEYREALLPLAHQTDIVVIPIGGDEAPGDLNGSCWRRRLISWLRRGLTAIHRAAPGPDAINHGWRHSVSNLLYFAVMLLTGSEANQRRRQHLEGLTKRVIGIARQNPGSRVLVVVNVQYCHHIRPRLSRLPDIRGVKYTDL